MLWQTVKFFSSNVYLWIWVISAAAFFSLCRRKKWIIFTGVGLYALFWIAGCRFFAEALLRPLEYQYPAPDIEELKAEGVMEVMILGGGAYTESGSEMACRHLTESSSMRMLGGLEIATKLGENARIICTGGGMGIPEAEYMKEMIQVLQPYRVVFADNEARRTVEHAKTAVKYLKNNKFVLVTTAYHIPRSMKAFASSGYEPVPYPVDYQFDAPKTAMGFFPSTEVLYLTYKAVHEYWAMIIFMISDSRK